MLSPLAIASLASCLLSAVVLVGFLVTNPVLTARIRMRLFFALGILPLAAAGTSTAYGLHRTTEREFCGSCHVMTKHLSDAMDPESTSLAARHTRNKMTGGQSCYVCHSDYSALGYPLTKLNGMNHVYQYYLNGYRQMPLETALHEIRVARPYPNGNCMQCHSGKLDSFQSVREHRALQTDLLANQVACASAGCHGYSHPFSKKADEGTRR
jgi:cytochrome c-type protein NapC